MKRIIVVPLLLVLLPIYIQEPGRAPVGELTSDRPAVEPRALRAVSGYIDIMQAGGKSPDEQGVLIEALAGGQTLAALNPNVTFNPASVMKLATSLTALVRFGLDYRFITNFCADGAIDIRSRTLEGDLVV